MVSMVANKRILLILAVVIMLSAVFFSACTGEESSTSDSATTEGTTTNDNEATASDGDDVIRIGACVMDVRNPYHAYLEEGYDAFNEAAQGKVVIEYVDGEGDPEKQVSVVENYIQKGVDAIILNAIDASATKDVVDKALAQGILVEQYPNQEGITAALTYDEYNWLFDLGVEAGKWINDKLGGEATVASFNLPTIETAQQRYQGFVDGVYSVADKDKVNMLEPIGSNDQETAYAGMETLLQAHPDIKVACAITDGPALGAYEAIVAAGKASDDFFVGGADGQELALDLIEEGTIFRCDAAGKLMVSELGFRLAENIVKAKLDLPYEREFLAETMIVDKSNIKEFRTRKPDYTIADDVKEKLGIS
jgi:ABC-type sugar transport system substrate-binding protein